VRYRAGSIFETAWSLIGLSDFLLDLASAPAKPVYIMERIAETQVDNLRRVLAAAGDRIDIVYFYDDLATQDRLLMSPRLYERHIQPFHRRIFDLAHRYGKPVMMHCCGSAYALIPRLIDMGLAILNPVQTSAKNMRPEKLAAEFGRHLAFHGGIDVQEFLPRARPQAVRENVARTSGILGVNGGYICAGSHHIQADTPLENILAMYAV
jgi:uroporphyrinogen decarboxylase